MGGSGPVMAAPQQRQQQQRRRRLAPLVLAAVALLASSSCGAWAFVPPPPRGLAMPIAGQALTGSPVALGGIRSGGSKRRGRSFGWRNILGHGGRSGSGGGGGGSGGGGSGGSGDGDSFGWSKGGSGDDGEGDDGVALAPDVASVLGRAGRRFAELPGAVQKAIVGGGMTSAVLERYLELERQGGVLGWFLGMGLFRDRLLMDGQLLEKLGIEMAVGAAAQLLAEWERRRERLWQELDFAFADVLTCLVANFAAVLIAAPAVGAAAAGAGAAAGGAMARRHIPANAFQMVPPGGQPYKLIDRVISPFLKVPSLFTVGLVGSLLGYGTTHALATARARLTTPPSGKGKDRGAVAVLEAQHAKQQQHQQEKEIPVLKTSLAVGLYLAVSTNIRYQLVSGVVEERLIAPWLAGHRSAGNLASFLVRSCNTYVGSAMMIDFLKLLGLQS